MGLIFGRKISFFLFLCLSHAKLRAHELGWQSVTCVMQGSFWKDHHYRHADKCRFLFLSFSFASKLDYPGRSPFPQRQREDWWWRRSYRVSFSLVTYSDSFSLIDYFHTVNFYCCRPEVVAKGEVRNFFFLSFLRRHPICPTCFIWLKIPRATNVGPFLCFYFPCHPFSHYWQVKGPFCPEIS